MATNIRLRSTPGHLKMPRPIMMSTVKNSQLSTTPSDGGNTTSRGMVATLQLPPLVKGNKSTLNTGLSLGNAIHKLHDAILNIALPKTKTAKTVSIPIETLHLACDLAGSMCTLLQEHHTGSQLDDISRQLKAIQTQLATPSEAQLPQKLSYAATLATGIASSSPKADLPPPWHLDTPCEAI